MPRCLDTAHQTGVCSCQVTWLAIVSGAPRAVMVYPTARGMTAFARRSMTARESVSSQSQASLAPALMRPFSPSFCSGHNSICDGSSRILYLKRRLDWPSCAMYDPERFVRVGPCAGLQDETFIICGEVDSWPHGNLIQFELCSLNFVKSVAVESAFFLPSRAEWNV